MGLDFIHSRAKHFERSWSRNLRTFAEPNLFGDVDESARTCVAVPSEGKEFTSGKTYLVSRNEAHLTVTLNGETIGGVPEPPPAIIERMITHGCNEAVGTVERVHPVSRAADLSIR
jgi:hypothetical protein